MERKENMCGGIKLEALTLLSFGFDPSDRNLVKMYKFFSCPILFAEFPVSVPVNFLQSVPPEGGLAGDAVI